MSDNRGSVVTGVILVMLGLAFLAMQVLDDASGAFVPLGLGVAFLVSHFAYQSYGFLVPGCILSGLGAGLLAEEMFVIPGEPIVLGLGAGFVLIWLIDRGLTRKGPESGAWWPLVPGGVLVFAGVGSMAPDVTETVLRFGWAIALVVLGVILIVRGLRGSGR